MRKENEELTYTKSPNVSNVAELFLSLTLVSAEKPPPSLSLVADLESRGLDAVVLSRRLDPPHAGAVDVAEQNHHAAACGPGVTVHAAKGTTANLNTFEKRLKLRTRLYAQTLTSPAR